MALWGRKATTTETDPDLLTGLKLYDGEKYAESVPFLRLAANRNSGFAAFKLANALSELGQERAAISYWKKSIALGNKDSLTNLALRYSRLGFKDAALAMYLEAAANGSDDAMHAAGVIQGEAGNLAEFEILMQSAAEAGNIRAYANWGFELYNVGQKEKGISILERGMAAGSISCFAQLAQILSKEGKLPEAISYLRKGLALEEVDFREKHMVRHVRNLLGLYLYQSDNFEEAIPILQESADEGDENAMVLIEEYQKLTVSTDEPVDNFKSSLTKTAKREKVTPQERVVTPPRYRPTLIGHF